MKIFVIADDPLHSSIELTKGKSYEVITYFEHQGDKLVMISDDTCVKTTYSICHFTDIIFHEG